MYQLLVDDVTINNIMIIHSMHSFPHTNFFDWTNLIVFEEDIKAFVEGVDSDDELIGSLLLPVDVETVGQDDPLFRVNPLPPFLFGIVVLEPGG